MRERGSGVIGIYAYTRITTGTMILLGPMYVLPHLLVRYALGVTYLSPDLPPGIDRERGDEYYIVYTSYLYAFSFNRILFSVVLMPSPSFPRYSTSTASREGDRGDIT